MIRKANKNDIAKIVEIYNKILSNEENGLISIGWIRGIYPTYNTAKDAIERGDLFVYENEKKTVAASAIINKRQVDVYKKGKWKYKVNDDKVMVLHTLTVDPSLAHSGIGRKFVNFYENYAKKNNCIELRIDTNEKNTIARAFYKKIGFSEIDIIPTVFNGIPNVNLVLLEKHLEN